MHTPSINYNIASSVLKRAQLDPNSRACIFEGQELSFSEMDQRVRKLAQSLRDGGVCLGDRVGFVGLNHPSFLEAMLATHSLGAIFVPLNFRLTGEELTFIINDAGIHTLIADDQLLPVISSVRDRLCCTRYIASGKPSPDWDEFEGAISESVSLQNLVETSQSDVAFIMYTSGTTGLPKGAMLTHGSVMWNNLQSAYGLPALPDDISLVCAPLFHIGGLNVTTLCALQAGACVLIHRNFDPENALTDISKYGVTTMFAAPAMLLFMSQQPGFDDSDLSSLRMVAVGAAPVPKALLEIYGGRGVTLNQVYGLTETSPLISFLMAQYTDEKLGSAGKSGLFGEIRVVDAQGKSLPSGEVGEIIYRGANVMKGYWNRPEATAEAIDEAGWFHTGDAGYLDSDGFLFISDRVKDMVISGGENVYPAEVESVLFEHDAIAEVAVIGLPDEKWGEAVTAVVALNSGKTISLEELRSFAGSKLARYKLPLRLHQVDALPRNPAGKVLKFKLREDLASHTVS